MINLLDNTEKCSKHYLVMVKMINSCSWLTCELFYKDKPGWIESTLIAAADDKQLYRGLQTWRNFVRESREFDMIGRICGDIFLQERYMLNGVDMKINSSEAEVQYVMPDGSQWCETYNNLQHERHASRCVQQRLTWSCSKLASKVCAKSRNVYC